MIPIVLVHGFMGGSEQWEDQVYCFCKDFEVIAIDLPGFGKSKEPESSMNPKEYAEYINQFIPNSVETVVGHSFGGRVAVHLSGLRNFEKLILIGVPLIKKQTSSGKLSMLNFYKSLNRFGILPNDKLEKIKNRI